MSVKIVECKHDGWTTPVEIGKYVRLEEYQALQMALCEALDKLDDYDEYPNARIAKLRAQFLDDQTNKEPSC